MVDEVIIGVDGGGSKTRALVADRDGRILGAGHAGSSNYHAVGIDRALDRVGEALAAAWEEALSGRGGGGGGGGAAGPVRAVAGGFGLAGVNRPGDREVVERAIRRRAFAPARFEVVNDVELLLEAGTGEGWGIALVGGTGSIGFGKDQGGRSARAGGWGYILGDEGSGYSIALGALRLATQTADGRADADAVLEAVLAHWGLDEPEQLLGTVYRPDMTIAEISGLTSRIVPLAEAGDPAATALIDRAAAALAALVDAVADALELGAAPLAMAGGVLRASALLRDQVLRYAETEITGHRVVVDPALGALAIARRLAGAANELV